VGDPIFLGYDRDALDREYDNRRKVARAAEHIAWYARESEAARHELAPRLDVEVGSHPGERLDLFLPPPGAPRPAPVHAFIHGGYWQRMDKADFSYVARPLVAAGAAVAVIDYALMPGVRMAELVRQCRAALAWLHRHAASFGGDPARLTVSGHSAGGHLVAMMLATDWPAFSAGLPADLIAAGCAISGLYDLEPIRLCYLNDVLALTPEDARAHSPALLTPPRPCPLAVMVGALEGPEYHRQVDALVSAWRPRGVPLETHDLPGHDHFSIMACAADPAAPLTRLLLRQLGLG
jgi:arylformamidase